MPRAPTSYSALRRTRKGARYDSRRRPSGYRNPEEPQRGGVGPVSRRGLFAVGEVAAAAADIREHVAERDYNGDDVVRADPAVLRGGTAAVAGRAQAQH